MAYAELYDVYTRFTNLRSYISHEFIAELRDTLMLVLKTNLRTKFYMYYINCALSKNFSQTEHQAMLEKIGQVCAWLLELSETEVYDQRLFLGTFANSMYSNEYGAIRMKIPESAFVEGEMPIENTSKLGLLGN